MQPQPDAELVLQGNNAHLARNHRRGPRPLTLHISYAEWAWHAGNKPQLRDFYRGIKAYKHHPYRRRAPETPIIWNRGDSKLLDYGPDNGFPLLIIPSLINRAYILNLMPGASLTDFLCASGVRPFLLDWGDGFGQDRRLTLDELILERVKPAIDQVLKITGKRPLVLGYCMGGTLATALACLHPNDVAGLALLATPWDFHAGGKRRRPILSRQPAFVAHPGHAGSMPVDVLQAMFTQIDPMSVPRKFASFARMAPTSNAAYRFVAIEDWLNDGVPLGADVASACLTHWYGNNLPARGLWKVDGYAIRPERLRLPVFLAIPDRDRIVPPASASALADIISRGERITPRAGHVGMMAGRHAEVELWSPLKEWLLGIAATQKTSW